jgi:hypothetical protein
MSRRRVASAYGSQAMLDFLLHFGTIIVVLAACSALLFFIIDSSPDY